MRRLAAIALLLALAACDSYPRDIEGTRDRVAATRTLRVGYATMPPEQRALADRFVERVADGAQIERQQASLEALFAALEHDDLDMVMAEVAGDSPWLTEVAVIEPIHLRKLGDRELGLSAIAANGENRWVMVLESATRDMRRQP